MTPEQQAAYVDAAAVVLGLRIEDYRDGVVHYFALAAQMNALLDAFPLGVHDESAEVFQLPSAHGTM